MVRSSRLLVGSLLVVSAVAVAAPAGATTAVNVCSTDASFCTNFGYSVTDASTGLPTTTAATPVNLSLDVSNTSPNVATDMNTWWKTLSVTAGTIGSSAPVVTTSAAMPDNLLVAGTRAGITTCSAPFDSVKCPAGWGTARVNITGTPFGAADGIYSGSFGIVFIRNNRSGVDSTHPLALVAHLKLHFPGQGFFPTTDLTVDEPIRPTVAAGTGGGTVGLTSLSIPVTQSGQQTVSNVTANYDASLESIHLGFNGKSHETTTATLSSAVTVVTAPRACGTDSASVSATDRANASVSQPESIDFTGCPTMNGVTGHADAAPFVGDFTASATAGARPINHYEWTFGDGTKASTVAPSVAHAFARGAGSASVVAVDALGARSAAASMALTPTSTTGRQVSVTRLSGKSTSAGVPATGTVTLKKCATSATAFAACSTVTSMALSNGNWSFAIPRPLAVTHYAVVLPGAGSVLGSAARIDALPQSTISIAAPTSGIRGRAIIISGRVSGPLQPGQFVLVQTFNGRTWITVRTVRLSSISTYAAPVTLTSALTSVRVVRPASSRNLVSVSAVRKIIGR